MGWTEVPDKQKNITPEDLESSPYPKPEKSVLVTVEMSSAVRSKDGKRKVLVSSLNPQVWNENYQWLQANGPAKVIAWKNLPDPYEN
jgi:hypothetical protein